MHQPIVHVGHGRHGRADAEVEDNVLGHDAPAEAPTTISVERRRRDPPRLVELNALPVDHRSAEGSLCLEGRPRPSSPLRLRCTVSTLLLSTEVRNDWSKVAQLEYLAPSRILADARARDEAAAGTCGLQHWQPSLPELAASADAKVPLLNDGLRIQGGELFLRGRQCDCLPTE